MNVPKRESKALEQELENPDKQEKLRKWIPYLWIAPIGLILVLGSLAYCAR